MKGIDFQTTSQSNSQYKYTCALYRIFYTESFSSTFQYFFLWKSNIYIWLLSRMFHVKNGCLRKLYPSLSKYSSVCKYFRLFIEPFDNPTFLHYTQARDRISTFYLGFLANLVFRFLQKLSLYYRPCQQFQFWQLNSQGATVYLKRIRMPKMWQNLNIRAKWREIEW